MNRRDFLKSIPLVGLLPFVKLPEDNDFINGIPGKYSELENGEWDFTVEIDNPGTIQPHVLYGKTEFINCVVTERNQDMYMITKDGIAKSRDSGLTWILVTSGTHSLPKGAFYHG